MKKVLELIEAALKALADSKATGLRAESIEAHLKACASNARADIGDGAKPKEAGFTRLKVMFAVAIVSLAGFFVSLAYADSFNTTNYIPSNTSSTPGLGGGGWGGIFPTNQPATNGIGTLTGGAIGLANQNFATFYFQAQGVLTNQSQMAVGLSNILIQLVRAPFDPSVPGVNVGTNIWTSGQTNVLQSDWETAGVTSAGLPIFPTNNLLISIPVSGTNAITFSTNLNDWVLGGAQWIGVGWITNYCTNLMFTNVTMGLNKKIIPIRYP